MSNTIIEQNSTDTCLDMDDLHSKIVKATCLTGCLYESQGLSFQVRTVLGMVNALLADADNYLESLKDQGAQS